VKISGVTYRGPQERDDELLTRLPDPLRSLLSQINGFILMGGALHVRGACKLPAWHSLEEAWIGERSFSTSYEAVDPQDVPFAEDALGDQFLLRDGVVNKLHAETGSIEFLGRSLFEFLEAVQEDPLGELQLEPFISFYRDGGRIQPGELLMAYPPFCTRESEAGVSFKAVPTHQRLGFLADFSAKVSKLPGGARISIQVVR
jgi:hypothetical protein